MAATTVALLSVLAALTAALASAVRSSRGSGPPGPAVVARLVGPGSSAMAPGPTGPTIAAGAVPEVRHPGFTPPPATPAAEEPVVTTPAPVAPSRAVGSPNRGRLERGVLLPAEGPNHVTWDAVDHVVPNRDWRRVGTDRLVALLLTVGASYRRAHPGAPRLVVSDLSLPEGGRFGSEYGGLGHASHQNGLDVDIAYPRTDRREVGVDELSDIDHRLAQALVDAWVAAGAQFVFVGPRTGLHGPRGVVQRLADHDDHLHVRIPNPG